MRSLTVLQPMLFALCLLLVIVPVARGAEASSKYECEALLLEMLERSGEHSVVNPQGRNDNCVACSSAFLRNAFTAELVETAQTIEEKFGYTGRERKLNVDQALSYVQRATNSTASPKPVAFNNPDAQPGYFVIFAGRPNAYVHVVTGRIWPDGRRAMYDPQVGAVITWGALATRYGGGRSYLLTPNR